MKTRLYNTNQNEFISQVFNGGYFVDGEKPQLPDEIVELTIVDTERPQINNETQKAINEWVLDLQNKTYTNTWTILDKTPSEISEYRNSTATQLDNILDIQLQKDIIKSQVTDLPNNVDKYITVYDYYRVNNPYNIGDIFRYENELYEVIQNHTSQYDWYPDVLPALYRKIRLTLSPWQQPAGGHDAYNLGDRVTYNGNTWESTINANVWAPGVYGWIIVT